MEYGTILLVEDSPDGKLLTRRTLKKNDICNDVVVARDGAEALDYLFARGKHEGRDLGVMPQLLLVDLKLPKVDGLEVLRRVRGDERTRLLPAVILTSSEEQEEDLIVGGGCGLGAISFVRKPVDAAQFRAAIGQLDTYWMVSNAPRWALAAAFRPTGAGLRRGAPETRGRLNMTVPTGWRTSTPLLRRGPA